ncbi:unnamed protein product [Paramecium octaurelia]|uniref:Transmembrane protein n=1 Tax=Paramecium octaurelia TaxID=43137 RepID=A0A8S1WQY2_PAROT|nr:unnamed protein product [Paramecium octaurelia]
MNFKISWIKVYKMASCSQFYFMLWVFNNCIYLNGLVFKVIVGANIKVVIQIKKLPFLRSFWLRNNQDLQIIQRQKMYKFWQRSYEVNIVNRIQRYEVQIYILNFNSWISILSNPNKLGQFHLNNNCWDIQKYKQVNLSLMLHKRNILNHIISLNLIQHRKYNVVFNNIDCHLNYINNSNRKKLCIRYLGIPRHRYIYNSNGLNFAQHYKFVNLPLFIIFLLFLFEFMSQQSHFLYKPQHYFQTPQFTNPKYFEGYCIPSTQRNQKGSLIQRKFYFSLQSLLVSASWIFSEHYFTLSTYKTTSSSFHYPDIQYSKLVICAQQN